MATERRICCCGASTWTKVIAWIQIVGSVLFSIACVVLFEFDDKETKILEIAFSFVPSIVFMIMAIILLKGTNQKRVGYLRAWIIYETVVFACAILSSILLDFQGFHYYYEPFLTLLDIIYVAAMALHAFALTVVYIHMKEINEGVFDLHPNEPVTTALERTICGGRASSWTPVIAWILIVANTINLIAAIIYFSSRMEYLSSLRDFAEFATFRLFIYQEMVFSAVASIFYVLGIIMAIILLKGTNQKRVGFLRVWLIYGGVAIAGSILPIIRISLFQSIHEHIRGYTILSVKMALNVFALLVVYIHRIEINDGVFDLQPKQSTVIERSIWCVGASIWTPFIAWIQISANTSNLIGAIYMAAYPILRSYDEAPFGYLESTWASIIISIVFSFLGIIMAIVLLKGTNQKRVSYLRAWIIYGGAALAVSVLLIIAMVIVNRIVLYHVVLEVAFDIFSLVVIHIHRKEINEGVFDLQPRQPLTMADPHGETIYLQ